MACEEQQYRPVSEMREDGSSHGTVAYRRLEVLGGGTVDCPAWPKGPCWHPFSPHTATFARVERHGTDYGRSPE